MTADGDAPTLLEVGTSVITNPATGLLLAEDVQRYPGFLTLEEYVCKWGNDLGFSNAVIEAASSRVEWLDRLIGAKRYETSNGE